MGTTAPLRAHLKFPLGLEGVKVPGLRCMEEEGAQKGKAGAGKAACLERGKEERLGAEMLHPPQIFHSSAGGKQASL